VEHEPKVDSKKKHSLSWPKRLLFLGLVIFVLLIAIELALRATKKVIAPKTVAAGSLHSCDSIVFVCVGDSMTYGLGAPEEMSYPVQFPGFWNETFPNAPAKIYNLGIAGSNTTEQLYRLSEFFVLYKQALPDFGLILVGINNRWNLHNASFWRWDDKAKKENYSDYLASRLQLNKFFQIAKHNRAESAMITQETRGPEFRALLSEHGWNMFFDSFKDDLLSRWIEKDLATVATLFRKHGVEPVFLTYHYPRFPHLNNLLRDVAKKNNAILLDIEKPVDFYSSGGLLAPDQFHLNAKGYGVMAQQIVKAMQGQITAQSLQEKLAGKMNHRHCFARNKASGKSKSKGK
jgi:lysophospholipase L1-like esterase